MDACLGYLHEVDVLMESYIELPLYQDIFEAADPEIAAVTAKNAETKEKSLNLLQKAAKVCRDIFKKVQEIIHTIFTWLGMSKTEKTAYQEFVKECKANPEFAGKKVTIHDFRKINDEYNKTLKKYENEYRSIKDSEEEARPSLVKDMEEGLKNLADKTKKVLATEGAAVTVESALTYCKSCQENAAQVEMMLKFDMGLLDELEKQLGSKQMKIAKLQIKMLSSKHKIIRYIAGGREEQVKTLRDSIKDTITAVRKVKVGDKTYNVPVGAAKVHLRARIADTEGGAATRDFEREAVSVYSASKKKIKARHDYAKDAYEKTLADEQKAKEKTAKKEAKAEKKRKERKAREEYEKSKTVV